MFHDGPLDTNIKSTNPTVLSRCPIIQIDRTQHSHNDTNKTHIRKTRQVNSPYSESFLALITTRKVSLNCTRRHERKYSNTCTRPPPCHKWINSLIYVATFILTRQISSWINEKMRSSKRAKLTPRNDDGPSSSRSDASTFSFIHFNSSGIVGYGRRKFSSLLDYYIPYMVVYIVGWGIW